jgi:putative lipoic acid-binding regulatory protein
MAKKSNQSTESLLTFPCDFIIKVFGTATDEFETEVFSILHKHVPELPEGAVTSRNSENNKYRAFTITVHVNSKEQLDKIYQDLSSSPHILMAL